VLSLQPDGKIVVVGDGSNGGVGNVSLDMAVARYNPDGTPRFPASARAASLLSTLAAMIGALRCFLTATTIF